MFCNRDKPECGYTLITLLYPYFHPNRKPFYPFPSVSSDYIHLPMIVTLFFTPNKVMYSAKQDNNALIFKLLFSK